MAQDLVSLVCRMYLQDPDLTLYDGPAQIDYNDNWEDGLALFGDWAEPFFFVKPHAAGLRVEIWGRGKVPG